MLITNISKSTLLEFCGTYFGSQRGGLDVLFTTPSMDDLVLVYDDNGNDQSDHDDGSSVVGSLNCKYFIMWMHDLLL